MFNARSALENLASLIAPRSVRAALEEGGGRVVAGGSGLSRGVTHVVCQPEAALTWLSMGKLVGWRREGARRVEDGDRSG